ncbi:DUF2310 family Zn-ribbon-containing protein [Alishewanella tabrizica]|uniref:Zn-ribbon-containing protein n=1 Tax=Alishewanella tabrizica TaxID=671278 RepID=A0ABQ2WH69_9ALTE|nr:DUF2310 family Zn-ribbon-containing protein [Alishewanella tabrizica]GGW51499.1 Zn-ribbon-containing protein [Alishewanella tabrizica]
MYLAELRFKIIADTQFAHAEQAIRQYIEALIFNGQVLGREFPTAWQQEEFVSRIVVPSEDALQPKWHSDKGRSAEQLLGAAGLSYPRYHVLGQDILSQTSCSSLPKECVLFTTFADTCSPIRCAETLQPVPLFWLTPMQNDHEALIRWQLQFQALDEIQLQEQRVLHKVAENSLQGWHSTLNRVGRQLSKHLSKINNLPIYYALYSGSAHDCNSEPNKTCPNCGKPWRISPPQAGLFDFRCTSCFIMSNIAWECQSNSGE